MKYIFVKKSKFEEPIRILFLCGSMYSKTDSDKRNVLKDYLEENSTNKVILLEKDFVFSASNNDFLSYYNFGLKNLYNIEMLASLVANKIIILHESYSTAGEIGVFASNNLLRKKIITLIPNRYAIEEEKFSSFLKLAFWNYKEKIIDNNVIQYYPVVENIYVSDTHNKYYTYFYENKIPKTVGDLLTKQIGDNEIVNMGFKYTEREVGTFDVNIDFSVLKNYIFSFLSISSFRQRLYECENYSELKSIFKEMFESILKNTIEEEKGAYPKKLKFIINEQIEFNLTNCINFIILTLHTCGFIKIVCKDSDSIRVHHVKDTMNVIKNYSALVKPIKLIDWGE